MRISTHIAALGLLWTSVFVGVLAACDADSRASDGWTCESQLDCSRGYTCDSQGRCVVHYPSDTVHQPDADSARDVPFSWNEWGTTIEVGSVPAGTDAPVCSIADVRLNDMSDYEEEWAPDDTPSPTPLADEWGRCGDDLETLTWRLANCERLARDIQPLACDLRLVWAGREHSADMRYRRYFSHVSPEGEASFRRLDARQIPFVWAGENLAHYSDVGGAHASWMLSEGHRRNILNDQYTHMGVGVVQDTDGDLYMTGLYIRP